MLNAQTSISNQVLLEDYLSILIFEHFDMHEELFYMSSFDFVYEVDPLFKA